MHLLASKSFNFTFLISRAHKVPYVKNRQEPSCSPCCQASHFWADYFMCFIKFDVRKCLHFNRAGINTISGKNNCTLQFHAKFLFLTPANLCFVPWADTKAVASNTKQVW